MEVLYYDEKYNNLCKTLKTIFERKYKQEKVELNNVYGNTELVVNNKICISINKDSNWKEINLIYKKKKETTKHSCNVCLHDNEIEEYQKATVNCTKCSQYVCIECYADIIEHEEGIFKCPTCRFEVGMKMPWYNLIQMRDNLNIKRYELEKNLNKK